MEKTERSIGLYSSLLIAGLLNSGKLLALRGRGVAAYFWRFDLQEYLLQILFVFGYCWLLFELNLRRPAPGPLRRVLENMLFFFACALLAGVVQYRLFGSNHLSHLIFWCLNAGRFLLSTFFVGIMIRIVLLQRESREKEYAHEQLRHAYLEAELELLKGQINPHFLFNSLSSLSGLVRENASLAQQYINHLARVFRYALEQPGTTLVTVADELKMLDSYRQLLQLRFEEGFRLEVAVAAACQACRLPHLSLQPLLENAVKHNIATRQKPLQVRVFTEASCLVVSNNLQPVSLPEQGAAIGLHNLKERYRILMQAEITVLRTDTHFIIKLPLKK
ncbi:MAG TPA: histidine kinase [Chitinophaga sp.]